jgi:hypothetical protein
LESYTGSEDCFSFHSWRPSSWSDILSLTKSPLTHIACRHLFQTWQFFCVKRRLKTNCWVRVYVVLPGSDKASEIAHGPWCLSLWTLRKNSWHSRTAWPDHFFRANIYWACLLRELWSS